MPTYDYECTICGECYEVTRGFREEGGDACPRCGAKGQFVFSPTPTIFKCGGFYVTDTKPKDPKALAEKSESAPPAKTAEIKSEAKPAADAPAVKAEPAKPPPTPPASK
jgi:putative FmdB family regulatory protein